MRESQSGNLSLENLQDIQTKIFLMPPDAVIRPEGKSLEVGECGRVYPSCDQGVECVFANPVPSEELVGSGMLLGDVDADSQDELIIFNVDGTTDICILDTNGGLAFNSRTPVLPEISTNIFSLTNRRLEPSSNIWKVWDWRTVNNFHRFLADVNGDGGKDLVLISRNPAQLFISFASLPIRP